ncbi:hypothetical protein V1502_16475 [Bacillus sp. SCS-153A]|uniref:hypothetical protein n=1 Tax=Rossellomorea sedimentorum TaxID=3115294 RepID=UPI00390643A9
MPVIAGVLSLLVLCGSILFLSSLALSDQASKNNEMDKPNKLYRFLFNGYY